ncbi:MAG: hypothetical protein JKX85_02645 [Phycisphaeraceae bacterium]|nr:hypothetical protein [Phycisphaeraceae bacterium]
MKTLLLRLFSGLSSVMLALTLLVILLRLFLFAGASTPELSSSREHNSLKATEPSNIQIQPTETLSYDVTSNTKLLEKSPFVLNRSKYVRPAAPLSNTVQPRPSVRIVPPPPPKTGRLLGIFGRGLNKRAIIAVDGNPAPLEVKLGENSPLGTLIRIERSHIALDQNGKTIKLSLF